MNNSDPASSLRGLVESYLSQVKDALVELPMTGIEGIVSRLGEAIQNGEEVFTCGSGNSAMAASDLVRKFHTRFNLVRKPGGPGIRVRCLGDNFVEVSQWAEEVPPEDVLVKIMQGRINEGDILIAMSGDGNAKSILNAVQAATSMGATTIGLAAFGGGKVKDAVDYCLVVPGNNMEQVEDTFLPLLCSLIVHCLRNLTETGE